MMSVTNPTVGLREHLTTHLGRDETWRPALNNLGAAAVSLHLAVLVEPFLGWLLDGTKTIESRFSRVRCAPYGALHAGDVIAVKKTGGPVVGAFLAGGVYSYQLTPSRLAELRAKFDTQICATDNAFWNERADCTYATLVHIEHVRTLPAFPYAKKDRRGWVLLTATSAQQSLL
jgi:hypothetical protein